MAALDRPGRKDERGFAFVVSGCAEEGAVLVLGPEHITADTISRAVPVNCDAPEHYLATFTVDTDDVPEGATLAD